MIEISSFLNRYREDIKRVEEVEYSFKELINSDFWFEFAKKSKSDIEYLENHGSRITLGVKEPKEIFWDLIGLYCSSSEENPWKSPRYFRVAEVSEEAAFDDVFVIVNKNEIQLRNVHCYKTFPNCTKNTFTIPLSGEMQKFVIENGGLFYESDVVERWEEIKDL